MDPNFTLACIRETIANMQNDNVTDDDREACAEDLANQIEALDQWLSKGGFLPSDWKHK